MSVAFGSSGVDERELTARPTRSHISSHHPFPFAGLEEGRGEAELLGGRRVEVDASGGTELVLHRVMKAGAILVFEW